MLGDLNGWEFVALLLLALLIFGDRLPKVIGDGLRMLRNLRNLATDATADLSRELGTDIQLEDLHPKAFIRKHLLSEEDEATIRKPLQGVYDNLRSDITGVRNELKDVAAATGLRSGSRGVNGSSVISSTTSVAVNGSGGGPAASPTPSSQDYDLDAT